MDERVERTLDGLAPGELVAVALEPGPAWSPLVSGLWARADPVPAAGSIGSRRRSARR